MFDRASSDISVTEAAASLPYRRHPAANRGYSRMYIMLLQPVRSAGIVALIYLAEISIWLIELG